MTEVTISRKAQNSEEAIMFLEFYYADLIDTTDFRSKIQLDILDENDKVSFSIFSCVPLPEMQEIAEILSKLEQPPFSMKAKEIRVNIIMHPDTVKRVVAQEGRKSNFTSETEENRKERLGLEEKIRAFGKKLGRNVAEEVLKKNGIQLTHITAIETLRNAVKVLGEYKE